MNSRRAAVMIRELGPREGFQVHPRIIATEQKLELVHALAETGVAEVEVTSMVRPDRVPQLADAEALVAQLPALPTVQWSSLYLNVKGFERAEALPQLRNRGWINLASSETFLRKNMNSSLQQVIDGLPDWKAAFNTHKKALHGVLISTAFGCAYEGLGVADATVGVLESVLTAWDRGGAVLPVELCLADTVGLGTPQSVRTLIRKVRTRFPEQEISLHLHDTRGTGMPNVLIGLEEGVRIFECSVGGMGGCPFTKGAAGNVPSEDVAYLCEREGCATGLDLDAYIRAARLAETIVGERLPGKYMRIGTPQP